LLSGKFLSDNRIYQTEQLERAVLALARNLHQ
jgi:hypothetical protein